MPDRQALWTPEDLPFTGIASYYDSIPGSPTVDPRICLRIEVGSGGIELLAIVDTAAPWCILEPVLARTLMGHLEELAVEAVISSRLGRYIGSLYRGTIIIPAQEGADLSIDTTVFLSPDWPGGNFVGYQGFLERFRFAVDPRRNRFYFGSL